MFVSTVTRVQQQTISAAQHQTIPKDTTIAEDCSEMWGKFSSLYNLFRKKTIEKKKKPALCVHYHWENKVYISDFLRGSGVLSPRKCDELEGFANMNCKQKVILVSLNQCSLI